MRVAIAFADLAGYTRLTEEEGELTAVDAVERFVEAVEVTLPDEARVIKTIGDEAMIVGSDPAALTDWAVGFQRLQTERPLPRIAIHYGVALYRDGDYYGRDVNIASRVAARSAGGEVLVTRPVVETAAAPTSSSSGSPRSAQGLQRADRDLHRPPARGGVMARPAECVRRRRACWRAGRPVRGAVLGRPRLDLPARSGRADRRAPRGHRAARQLRPARGRRRGRAPLRRSCASGSGCALEVRRPRPARAGPGTCRRGRATQRYARGRASWRGARGRRRRGRAHRDRPGGDDPVPAGLVAQPAGAAGHAPARGAARFVRCSVHARGDRRVLRGAGSGLARGRAATTPTPTRATASATSWCRR